MRERLNQIEKTRYSRHLLLPEVGIEGQERLKNAKVLIVGLGGLGCPVANYLAAAGVGRIGLVDFDRVESSNLQRQTLYTERDCGEYKAIAAAQRLQSLNSNIEVLPIVERFEASNACDLIRPYDVVIDGCDNFTARYLATDACHLERTPYIYGSVHKFEGQTAIFDGHNGPCFRCLYPAQPPEDVVPKCTEAGVLGVLPGQIGIIQATETLKYILNIGESLLGSLLVIDALSHRYDVLKIQKDADCVLCGSSPSITEVRATEIEGIAMLTELAYMSAIELKQALKTERPPHLIDVRQPSEVEIAQIENSTFLPLDVLEQSTTVDFAQERSLVIVCKTGKRAEIAARELMGRFGFQNVKVLSGGIMAWRRDVDPSLVEY